MQRFTRRVLLASAAAVRALAAPAERVRLPREIRVAIYGTEGHVGEITEQLPRLPDVHVVGVGGADRRETEQLSRRTGAKLYPGLREMLESAKPNLVAVTNDNGGRAAAVLECLNRGLDVIAEKPLALTTGDLGRIKAIVASGRVHLGMLLPMRFEPSYLGMRNVVREGTIGEVAQIAAQKSYKAGTRPAWFLKRASYGGTIAWIGVHMIDLMRFTSGRDLVTAGGFQGHVGFPNLGEMENVTASMFRLDNGGVGMLRMDYLRPETAPTHGDDRLRLAGTRGVLEWSQRNGLLLIGGGQTERRVELPAPGSVFVDFLEHAYNGKPTQLPLADIWRANEITIAAQRAADRGTIERT